MPRREAVSPGDRGVHFRVFHMQYPLGSHMKHQAQESQDWDSDIHSPSSALTIYIGTETQSSRRQLELHPVSG